MKTTIITIALCLYTLSAKCQFSPNSETNYFEQKGQWEHFFDSIRQSRIIQGDSSMTGTGFSDFRRWKSFWELYMPASGNFNEAIEIYRLNQDFLKTQQFKSLQPINNNVNTLQVNPVNWDELGPKNLSKIKTYNSISAEWVDSHLNNNGQNPHYDFNNGQLKSAAHVAKIDRLFQHPIDENKIYACAGGVDNGGGGLFYSEDFGKNWVVLGTDKIPNPDIMTFAIKPSQSLPDIGVEYIFIGLSTGAVYRSIDNGINWIECNYYGTNNYPYWNSNPILPNSLPYDYSFLNRDAALNIDLNCDIKFTKKNNLSSKFSRIIVARTGGIFYSDNFNATLNPISNMQLNNQIQWSNMTDNIGDNFYVIKNTIPIYDPLTDNRLFHFTDFEFCERLGQTYYFIHFEVKEQNSSGDILGKIRHYVCYSTDYGVTWDFLGGLTSPNSPNAEELDVKIFPGNIEILLSEPNYLYVAAPKPKVNNINSYSLKKFDFNTFQWYDYSQTNNFYSPIGVQAHGFAIDKSNENNWWFFTNDVNKMKDGVYTSITGSVNYSKFHHADARDLLVLNNGTLLVGTDGGVYRAQIGINDHILNASSEGLNAAQTNSVSVAQKSPYYVTAGVWHSGIEIYNPSEDKWHWGSLSDGQIGGNFFLNNEIFSLSDQSFNISVLKNYNSLTCVEFGGEVASSENLYGRSYSVKRTSSNDELYFNNDDYSGALISLGLLFPKYSTTPKVIPNDPDKLALIIRAGSNQQFIKFYIGCNQPIPVPTEIQSIDIQQVYDPSGQEVSSLGTVIFDHRKNGRFWAVLRSSPVWGSFHENRIVEFDPDQGQYIDLSYPIDDNLTNSNIFPNWLSIRDLQLDRQTGILYLGTTNGVYYLDRENNIWRKYSLNVPLVDVDMDIRHCTGEIFVAGTNRGIWHTELIRNTNTPAIEWNIIQNETWNDRMNLFCTLVIKPGVTLTIKDELVVYGFQKIIVKPGGRLIVDGGKITSECGDYWQGIEVWGNSNLTQTAANQGTVILKNGATIEYAREAIQVWKYNDWSKTGGIVEATNSYFKNNWRSIAYYPYHSYSPVSGNEYPNKGRITNCEFTWDDDFIDINGVAPAITMNHVNGVLISGSDFIDNRTTNVNPHQRPNGIYTIDAGYKVVGRNIGGLNTPVHHDYSEINYDVCKFKNLQHGVYAMNSNSQFTVTVDHCKFEDMIYGVRLSSVDNALITRNKFDFTLTHPTDITVMHELVFDKCTGYKAEGNKFNSQIPSAPIEGTLVYNSGVSQNRIYRNDYTNVMTGNYSNGQNTNDMGGTNAPSGLQFLCNDHLNNQNFDEYVFTFPNANGNGQGIRLKQGSSAESAGNTLSSNLNPLQGKANIKSDDFDNIIYFVGSGNNQIPSVIGGVGTQLSFQNNGCLSTFSNTIVIQQKSILSPTVKSELIAELQSIGTQQLEKAIELDNLLQTGDSPYLHELVANLTPYNKQFVRSELSANSPYLSELLLKEVGDKTPGIYPHAWYKDLILANIEVAQTKTFIDYLNSKNVPLPSGLINQINEQKLITTTQRGEKIDFLTDLNTRKTVILDLLIQNELSDSVEIDWQAYKNWITQREDIICKSQMADMHLGKGEIIQCNEKLDYIDVHINEFMMDEIKQEMSDYSTFKKYVLTFVNEDGIIESLDSTQIEQLEYIANNFSGKSAVQARNLLCFHVGLCEDIEVVYATPNNAKSAQATNESSEESAYTINQTLKVIPNPNNGEFKLVMPENCTIQNLQIIDIHGKEIIFETIENNGEYLKLKMENTSTGIYTLKTNCSDGSVFVTRLLIK